MVWITTVHGRNPAAPGRYKIWKFTISTGAGFLPSTASPGRQLQKKTNLLAPRLTKTLLFAGQFQKGSFFLGEKKNKAIPNKGVDYGLMYSAIDQAFERSFSFDDEGLFGKMFKNPSQTKKTEKWKITADTSSSSSTSSPQVCDLRGAPKFDVMFWVDMGWRGSFQKKNLGCYSSMMFKCISYDILST